MRTVNIVCVLLVVSWCVPILAQHDMHNMSGMGAEMVSTKPANDEVMAAAPSTIVLQFGAQHVLVKLAVKKPGAEIVDTNFRFDPTPREEFSHSLPQLQSANYYEVEWAAITQQGKLIKGTFYFSFGGDANPPSYYLDQQDHRMEMMTPNYRLL